MAQTWWMTPRQLEKYQELSSELFELQKEHKKLIQKLRSKRISQEEVTRLREVIRLFNQRYTQRRRLEEQNPLLPENILKAMKGK